MQDWQEVRPWFETTAIAHLATIGRDGSPASVPLWVDVDGDDLVLFSLAGQAKDRNMQRDPRVAISITRPDDPYAAAGVRGEVVERIEGERARPIIDAIAQRYTGGPYAEAGDFVAFVIRPTSWWSREYSD